LSALWIWLRTTEFQPWTRNWLNYPGIGNSRLSLNNQIPALDSKLRTTGAANPRDCVQTIKFQLWIRNNGYYTCPRFGFGFTQPNSSIGFAVLLLQIHYDCVVYGF
jgi:hypothetical protein